MTEERDKVWKAINERPLSSYRTVFDIAFDAGVAHERKRIVDELLTELLSTAYITTGAIPTMGAGFASIRLTGVITKENLERVFQRYIERKDGGQRDD